MRRRVIAAIGVTALLIIGALVALTGGGHVVHAPASAAWSPAATTPASPAATIPSPAAKPAPTAAATPDPRVELRREGYGLANKQGDKEVWKLRDSSATDPTVPAKFIIEKGQLTASAPDGVTCHEEGLDVSGLTDLVHLVEANKVKLGPSSSPQPGGINEPDGSLIQTSCWATR